MRDPYNTPQYRRWRRIVRDRARGQCQQCAKYGIARDGNVAHHITPIDIDPSRMYDTDNGIYICYSCHEAAHKRRG